MNKINPNVGPLSGQALDQIEQRAAQQAGMSDWQAAALFTEMRSALITRAEAFEIGDASRQLNTRCDELRLSETVRRDFIQAFINSDLFVSARAKVQTRQDRSMLYFLSCLVRNMEGLDLRDVGNINGEAFDGIVTKAADKAGLFDDRVTHVVETVHAAFARHFEANRIGDATEMLRRGFDDLGVSKNQRERFVDSFVHNDVFVAAQKGVSDRHSRSALYFVSCMIRNQRDG